MRYNHFYSVLPERAFKPRSGRRIGFVSGGMTLEGGESSPAPWSQDVIDAVMGNQGGGDQPAADATPVQAATPIQSGPQGGVPADLNAIYQQYLGRGVDTSGAGTFAGMDAGSVIAAIQGSPEYAARAVAGNAPAPGVGGGGTNLNSIYQQYLGRGVDPSGAASFAGQSADAVINAILNSPEYASHYASLGGAGSTALPPGAAAALATMDVAPPWLPPAQYAQYGFNSQGKKDKEAQNVLAYTPGNKAPESGPQVDENGHLIIPRGAEDGRSEGYQIAPGGRYHQTFDMEGNPKITWEPSKFNLGGGTPVNLNQYGTGGFEGGIRMPDGTVVHYDPYTDNLTVDAPLSTYSTKPGDTRLGYRNQLYTGATNFGDTTKFQGQDVGTTRGEYLVDPKTGKVAVDKNGSPMPVYREPSGDSGFDKVMQQVIQAGIMVGGTAIGGPAGAATTAAILSGMNGGKTSDILRNAALAGGTAYLGGQLMGGEQSLAGPLGNALTMDPATLADLQLGDAMRTMANNPEAGLPSLESNAANPNAIVEPVSGLPTLETPSIVEPSAVTPTPNIPVAPPAAPSINDVLSQTYPDAVVGTQVPVNPLTPDVINAANLPTQFEPGTISAATNNVGYLPPNAPTEIVNEAVKENIKNGVSKWWEVTSSPMANAAIKNAIFGSAMGGITSGLTGGNIGKGALYGGIAGGVTGAGTQYLGSNYFPQGFNPSGNAIADAGIRNALAGAANSAIATKLAGGNAGRAALMGGAISGPLGALAQYYQPQLAAISGGTPLPTVGGDMTQANQNMDIMNEYQRVGSTPENPSGLNRFSNTELSDIVNTLHDAGSSLDQIKSDFIDSGMGTKDAEIATMTKSEIEDYLRKNMDPELGGPTGDESIDRAKAIEIASGTTIGEAGEAGIEMPKYTNTPLDQQYINQDLTEGTPITDTNFTDALNTIIPFIPFAANPPGKAPPGSTNPPKGPGGPGSKKPLKTPTKAGAKGSWDNYLLRHRVNAGNVYTPEATGYQSVGYKEGGIVDGIQHFDFGGSVANSLTNLFKPVEQNIIQPIGQAAPFLKDVLPYASIAAAPFLGPAAAAGIGALGSGFGTTPGAGFNMKRALMGGIASYGLSNIGSGLAEAGMTATTPVTPDVNFGVDDADRFLEKSIVQTPVQSPATTQGFWDQITNAPEKAKLMAQGSENLLKGGDTFTNAAKAFGTQAGMGSAGMAIMGGTGVLGVDEANAQNQAVAGTNNAAAQQRAIIADKRAKAKTNAQNAVAANPFHYEMGGMIPNPPDDQTDMPNESPLKNFEGGIQGYAMGGYAMGGEPRFLSGGGDGMSDSIHANIDGNQEARLADGEFVIPADVVSHLGNGSSKAGAKQLYSMMDRIRQARTGRKAQGREINPNKFMPV
jgi:hypothetical protein